MEDDNGVSMPSKVGRYRLDHVLGSGAFASVWLAHDDELDSHVAIKVLAPGLINDLDVRARFIDEARMLRRADSERLVRVHDIGQLTDGRPYFVMSYADRGTLADRLRGKRPLGVPEALRLATEIARGVGVIHRMGIIHRDLKPSNVLFQTVPGGERLLIADLGLAKALIHASGAFTMPVGTPGYMSPEQTRLGGGLDVRADVYGLGALTYHLLTGKPPGTAPVRQPPGTLRTGLPAVVDNVVMCALEMDRDRRWPTADALADALTSAVVHVMPEATIQDQPQPPASRPGTAPATGPPQRPPAPNPQKSPPAQGPQQHPPRARPPEKTVTDAERTVHDKAKPDPNATAAARQAMAGRPADATAAAWPRPDPNATAAAWPPPDPNATAAAWPPGHGSRPPISNPRISGPQPRMPQPVRVPVDRHESTMIFDHGRHPFAKPKRLRRGMTLLIAIVVAVLVAGGVVAYLMLS
jgi:serine/threonine protein kinase